MVNLEPWLLDVLACPKCKSPLRIAASAGGDGELACTNESCGLVYPVRDDVPVLLVDEARQP
ncbi:MAG: Trm112 family protein [Streptosporangiales bacterium]